MRCGGRRWNTWRPALEERPRRATTTRHARDFLSRAASQALRRNLAARHDRACPGGRSPTTARARARRPPAHPRVKGTRLLGAGGRTRKKGRISVATGGTRAPCGVVAPRLPLVRCGWVVVRLRRAGQKVC